MKKRKLRLHRETIRRLDANDLSRVAGGNTEGTCQDSVALCSQECTEACTRPISICNTCAGPECPSDDACLTEACTQAGC